MNAIVAVDKNWGIGYDGKLLFRLPEDLMLFKSLTINKVVVMGHDTLKSLPHEKPLPNRVNIVLSKDKNLRIGTAITCNSLEQLLSTISNYKANDVFLIGGQTVFTQLLSVCSVAYVTKIHCAKNADRFFPNLDALSEWRLESRSDIKTENSIQYTFNKYINIKHTNYIDP